MEPPTLPSLPLDVLESICASLSLQERVAFTSCCCTLLGRADVAGSPRLWGDLLLLRRHAAPASRGAALEAWLRRRRAGLRSLRIYLCSQADPAPLLRALASGSPLVDLHLSPCTTGSNSAAAGPGAMLQPLRTLTALTQLRLRNGQLAALPPELSVLSALKAFELNCNPPLGRAKEAAFRPLAHLPRLTRLELSDCSLRRLPGGLSALAPSLRDLCASGNREMGEGGEAPFNPLHHLSRLTRLAVARCGLCRLPSSLTSLPLLAELDAHSNRALDSWGTGAFWPLRQLHALTCLDLGECGLLRIPPEVSSLQKLVVLSVRGSPCLGVEVGAFWPLEHLPALAVLNAAGCKEGAVEGHDTIAALAAAGLRVNVSSWASL